MSRYKRALFRSLRLVLTTGASIGLQYGTYAALVELLDIWYMLASTVGFVCFIAANFTLQRLWALRKRTRPLYQHVLLHSGNQIAILVILYTLIVYLHVDELRAQALAMIFPAATSWLFYRKAVFHD